MAPKERRALVLLAGLAVAGHLILATVTGPGGAPGAVSLFDPLTDGDPLAHRERSIRLAAPLQPGERVDVDRAPAEELARLPGVGPALARRIVADREKGGAFGRPGGLDRVPGVGPAMLERLRPWLSFGGRPAEASAGPVDGMIDLNRASVADLDALPGIGRARAAAIVAFRDSVGPFRQLADLRQVPGLPASIVARIAPRLAFR